MSSPHPYHNNNNKKKSSSSPPHHNKKHLSGDVSLKLEDEDLEKGYDDEPSITWSPDTKPYDGNSSRKFSFSTEDERNEFRKKRAQERQEEATIQALVHRAFHLPGNHNLKSQDWKQYMMNTHPLLGLCCSDKRSAPFNGGIFYRLIVLGTSILVGITAVAAAFWWNVIMDENNNDNNNNNNNNSLNVQIPYFGDQLLSLAILSLFTWMSFVHAIHDCIAWYGCMNISSDRKGRLLFCSLWFLFWAGAATTFCALLYSTRSSTDDDNDDWNEYLITMVIYWGMELFLSWFLWYPIFATICFSGILGCNGTIPILGGRQYDIQKQKEQAQQHFKDKPVATLESLADYDDSTMGGNNNAGGGVPTQYWTGALGGNVKN